MYVVYAKITDAGNIVAINSSVFLQNSTDWVGIDQGDGDRYMHAQGNYLPLPLRDEQGRFRYKLVEGAVVERTPEELTADAMPASMPSDAERLAAVEAAVLDLVLGGELGG